MKKEIKFIDILKLDDCYKNKLRNWRNKDFVREKMFNDGAISAEEHKNFLMSMERNRDKRLFVAFYGEEPFGVVQYEYFGRDSNLEFGYYLIDEKYINSGLGMVLEYVLLNHSFYKLGVRKVFCRTLGFNQKVIELHSRFGFFTEGFLKEHICHGSMYIDICLQSIFAEIWDTNRCKIEKLLGVITDVENISELE